jgi:hypothetical protein
MPRFSPRAQHHADQSAAASHDGNYSEAYQQYQKLVAEDPGNAAAALARAHLADRDNSR